MKQRMFIAIPISQEIKLQIKALQCCLQGKIADSVKWVSPESIHVTLKFLGLLDDSLIENITRCIENASRSQQIFHFSVASLGVFPSFRRPKIIWAGIQDAEQILARLNQNLEQSVLPFGVKPEKRAFSPHLTLGRIKKNIPPMDLKALLQEHENTYFGQTKVDSIRLYQSDLTPTGAIYTTLSQVRLR